MHQLSKANQKLTLWPVVSHNAQLHYEILWRPLMSKSLRFYFPPMLSSISCLCQLTGISDATDVKKCQEGWKSRVWEGQEVMFILNPSFTRNFLPSMRDFPLLITQRSIFLNQNILKEMMIQYFIFNELWCCTGMTLFCKHWNNRRIITCTGIHSKSVVNINLHVISTVFQRRFSEGRWRWDT